jgi:hypothetical protein
VALHESVRSAGTYEVIVKVTSHGGPHRGVKLKIGRVSRHTLTRRRTHRLTVHQKVTLKARRLTIHASARRAAPTVTATWRRLKPARAPGPHTRGAGGSSSGPTGGGHSPRPDSAGPLGVSGSWRSVFDDEFDGGSLNGAVWNTGWLGSGLTGPMNTEEEECYGPGQDVVSGGELDINMVAAPQTGCPTNGGNGPTVNEPFLSGMVNTRNKFSYTYGYLETRVWLPAGAHGGVDWPGVWEVGNPAPADGEIDVVEGLSGQACWHFHDSSEASFGGCSGNDAGGWHTYGADWEPGVVTWYYDGERVGQETSDITGDPMYLIADLAADNTYGGPPGPATMRIDYIRVWQRQP